MPTPTLAVPTASPSRLTPVSTSRSMCTNSGDSRKSLGSRMEGLVADDDKRFMARLLRHKDHEMSRLELTFYAHKTADTDTSSTTPFHLVSQTRTASFSNMMIKDLTIATPPQSLLPPYQLRTLQRSYNSGPRPSPLTRPVHESARPPLLQPNTRPQADRSSNGVNSTQHIDLGINPYQSHSLYPV
ncbi:hypothetical protein BKA57DRAFT_536048 [Linnemannia elongata]|nr:hypothetical protein BKA57DRAFT_536048 [Linnemannia elongata]